MSTGNVCRFLGRSWPKQPGRFLGGGAQNAESGVRGGAAWLRSGEQMAVASQATPIAPRMPQVSVDQSVSTFS